MLNSSRRAYKSIVAAARTVLLDSQNVGDSSSSAVLLLFARQYAKVRPKPRRAKLMKLTPAVKRTLEGRDSFAEGDGDQAEKLGRNALKRRSDKALELARLLATLSSGQIKNVIRWASLPAEVYEATRIVQRMELSGVREGKRRQYNFLEGLIRHSRLDVLEYILQCVRCGETVSIQRVLEASAPEKEKYVKKTTERWIQGLLSNDHSVCRQVYSLPTELFDREELRRLIRELKMKLAQKGGGRPEEESEAIQKSRRRACSNARRVLFRFLASVARRDYNDNALVEPDKDNKAQALEVFLQQQQQQQQQQMRAAQTSKSRKMVDTQEAEAEAEAEAEEAEEEDDDDDDDEEDDDDDEEGFDHESEEEEAEEGGSDHEPEEEEPSDCTEYESTDETEEEEGQKVDESLNLIAENARRS